MDGTSFQYSGQPVQFKPGILGFIYVSGKDEIPKEQGSMTAYISYMSLENTECSCRNLGSEGVVLHAAPFADS